MFRLVWQALHRVAVGGRRGLERFASEEGVEHPVEPVNLLGALGQGCAQGVLEQLAIGKADGRHGAMGIYGFDRRHADVRRPQRPEEIFEGTLHGVRPAACE